MSGTAQTDEKNTEAFEPSGEVSGFDFDAFIESGAESENSERLSREEAIAEALVFAAGEPVRIESIAIATNLEKKDAYKLMEKLQERYEKRHGGIILRRLDKSFQFSTRPELRENLRSFFEKPGSTGLSRAAMETLSVICYNQPVTRAGIEYVRGVNSDGVLVRLIEKGLVEECGRSDAPGRPILYGTTVKFLQAMGIEKLSQLPQVTRIVINEEAPSEKFGADGAGQHDENTNEAEP